MSAETLAPIAVRLSTAMLLPTNNARGFVLHVFVSLMREGKKTHINTNVPSVAVSLCKNDWVTER